MENVLESYSFKGYSSKYSDLKKKMKSLFFRENFSIVPYDYGFRMARGNFKGTADLKKQGKDIICTIEGNLSDVVTIEKKEEGDETMFLLICCGLVLGIIPGILCAFFYFLTREKKIIQIEKVSKNEVINSFNKVCREVQSQVVLDEKT